jgi:AmmeMemoRadiSam system protein A
MIYSTQQLQSLLSLAKNALIQRIQNHQIQIEAPQPQDPKLVQPGAVFITLNKNEQLRGCIGTLLPHRPLYLDTVHNAIASALSDPRFPPVQANELEQLTLSISVLTPAEVMSFTDESNLKSKIHPGIDGLILEESGHRGTFLPSVWEQLPDVEQFWAHLKVKAGLPANYWSNTLKVSRYTTEYYKAPWSEIE